MSVFSTPRTRPHLRWALAAASEAELRLTGVPAGVYTVRVRADGQLVQTSRFVKLP